MDDAERLAHAVFDAEAGARLIGLEGENFEAEGAVESLGRVEEPSLVHGRSGYRSRGMGVGFAGLSREEQRLLELLAADGASYRDAARQLGLSQARARALAEEALAALTPLTAAGVDPEWRSDVVDYLLGQAEAVEAEATRSYLRRSQAARVWAASVVDTLAPLLGERVPEVPGLELASGAASAPRSDAGAPREQRALTARGARGVRDVSTAAGALALAFARRVSSLASRLRRLPRGARLALAAASLVALAGAVAVWPLGLLRGGEASSRSGQAASTTTAPRVVSYTLLSPPGQTPQSAAASPSMGQQTTTTASRRPAGIAILVRRGGAWELNVQAAGLEPSTRNEVYEVWLYNSPRDLRSLGGQVTDQQGNFVGVARLPRDAWRYRYVDISREALDGNRSHSGRSVLRGSLPRRR